jgi:hypothetical protein
LILSHDLVQHNQPAQIRLMTKAIKDDRFRGFGMDANDQDSMGFWRSTASAEGPTTPGFHVHGFDSHVIGSSPTLQETLQQSHSMFTFLYRHVSKRCNDTFRKKFSELLHGDRLKQSKHFAFLLLTSSNVVEPCHFWGTFAP